MERICRILGAFLFVAALSACETNTAEVAQEWQIERLATKNYWWLQDFSQNTNDWSVTRPNDPGSVTHNADSETASLDYFGRGSRFQRYVSYFGNESVAESATWLGDHIAELDVFIDFDWPSDTGFNLNIRVVNDGFVALNNSFRFSSRYEQFIVSADGDVAAPYEVPESGWYTFQHVFRDVDGLLVIDYNLLDADGVLLWSHANHYTLATGPEGTVGTAHSIMVNATYIADETFAINIDNHSLYQVVPGPQSMDDCKRGGFRDFGFNNQGQCIASVQANENATPHN